MKSSVWDVDNKYRRKLGKENKGDNGDFGVEHTHTHTHAHMHTHYISSLKRRNGDLDMNIGVTVLCWSWHEIREGEMTCSPRAVGQDLGNQSRRHAEFPSSNMLIWVTWSFLYLKLSSKTWHNQAWLKREARKDMHPFFQEESTKLDVASLHACVHIEALVSCENRCWLSGAISELRVVFPYGGVCIWVTLLPPFVPSITSSQ